MHKRSKVIAVLNAQRCGEGFIIKSVEMRRRENFDAEISLKKILFLCELFLHTRDIIIILDTHAKFKSKLIAIYKHAYVKSNKIYERFWKNRLLRSIIVV